MLNMETAKLSESLNLKAARLSKNRSLNRYRDVLPYDESRVKLDRGDSDYINANLVQCPKIGRKYILTQGPLPNTCADFWYMIWQENSLSIVMLNKVIEKNMIKCHPYWPMGEGEELVFGDFRVTNKGERMESSYIIRDLLLENLKTQESRELKHFHYIMWPDFGVPRKTSSFLEFLSDVVDSGCFEDDQGPPIVHCSAGIGRSGTICLVDAVLTLARQNGKCDGLNIPEMLLSLRKYRLGLIQTAEQLRFAYLAIVEGLQKMYPEAFVDPELEKKGPKRARVDYNSDDTDEEDDPSPPLLPRQQQQTTQNHKQSTIPPTIPPHRSNALTEQENQKEMFKRIAQDSAESSGDSEEEIIRLSDISDEEDPTASSIDTRDDTADPADIYLETYESSDEENDNDTKDIQAMRDSGIGGGLAPDHDDQIDLRASLNSRRQQRGKSDSSNNVIVADAVNESSAVGIKASEGVQLSGDTDTDNREVTSSSSAGTSLGVRHRHTDNSPKSTETKERVVEPKNLHTNVWMKTGIVLGISAGLYLVYKLFF